MTFGSSLQTSFPLPRWCIEVSFAAPIRPTLTLKALSYRHFEFANIQIKNWWNALYPEKEATDRILGSTVYLNAVPEIIKDYTEGIRDRWEKDKTIQKRFKKAVGEAPEILDISDKTHPAVYGNALFLRSITEFNLAYRELGEPIDPIEQVELQEAEFNY